jgi:hypothetical protein
MKSLSSSSSEDVLILGAFVEQIMLGEEEELIVQCHGGSRPGRQTNNHERDVRDARLQ